MRRIRTSRRTTARWFSRPRQAPREQAETAAQLVKREVLDLPQQEVFTSHEARQHALAGRWEGVNGRLVHHTHRLTLTGGSLRCLSTRGGPTGFPSVRALPPAMDIRRNGPSS